jgi:hypothetical protein
LSDKKEQTLFFQIFFSSVFIQRKEKNTVIIFFCNDVSSIDYSIFFPLSASLIFFLLLYVLKKHIGWSDIKIENNICINISFLLRFLNIKIYDVILSAVRITAFMSLSRVFKLRSTYIKVIGVRINTFDLFRGDLKNRKSQNIR